MRGVGDDRGGGVLGVQDRDVEDDEEVGIALEEGMGGGRDDPIEGDRDEEGSSVLFLSEGGS